MKALKPGHNTVFPRGLRLYKVGAEKDSNQRKSHACYTSHDILLSSGNAVCLTDLASLQTTLRVVETCKTFTLNAFNFFF